MLQIMVEKPPAPGILKIELKNTRPVDLIDLAVSLRALGEAYSDWAEDEGLDIQPQNLKLYIHELRTGSIIAELAPWMEQASLILDHAKTVSPFLAALQGAIRYFLGRKKEGDKEKPPSRELAQHIHAVMEPVAKDGGSQIFFDVVGDVHIHQYYTSQEANAIQNSVKRYLGNAKLPANERRTDEIMTLQQVRFDGSLRTGDRGVIETVSQKPVKVVFATPEAKRRILDEPKNPGQMAFLVDVEVRAIEGKPALYRVLEVKDSFERP